MKYSKLFSKTLKSAPSNADTVNHRLLVQAGYVRQVMAGVYTYTPLGLRVLNKISNIIREEMNEIGGQEVLMPLLHPSSIWKQTGGWDKIEVLFKVKSRTGRDYALAQSNEETVTPLVKEWIHSERDLPLAVYHINAKFRDELRSKSGILRGREFLMKDMYSWHYTQEDFDRFYQIVKEAYFKIFNRMGLAAKATEASGGAFTEKVSYEFEVLSEAGEAHILHCENCNWCVNSDDITNYKVGEDCPKCGKAKLQSAKAAELGNVFDLGTKYTKAFDISINNAKGEKIYPIMGCYGIGISRTMGVLVETFHDERGIIWPESVAPFKVHLISLAGNNSKVAKRADEIYDALIKAGVEVLYDERKSVGAGAKLADADLLGIPYRVIVSEKTGEAVELKKRSEKEAKLVLIEELLKSL
ncbi:MAG: proline--tRNA ligase [Candidatus Microgenomates bacterium]